MDTLCIDQEHIQEKDKHVLMMGAIYAGASWMHIWLGEGTGMEQLALGVLAGTRRILKRQIFALWTTLVYKNDFTQRPAQLNLTGKVCRCYLAAPGPVLVRRTHSRGLHTDKIVQFQRIWTVQEAANSRKAIIHIGDIFLDWGWVMDTLRFAKRFKMDTSMRSLSLKSVAVADWLRQS